MNPKVSIVILHFVNIKDTIECLNSLRKVDYDNFNVILVDNSTDQDDISVVSNKFGSFITIIKNDKNLGFAEGNNVGIRYALATNCDFVLLLNNDTIVDPLFLKKLVKTSAKNTSDMVSPKIYDYYNRSLINTLGHTYTKSGLCFDRKDDKYKLFSLSACCVLFSRKLLDEIKVGNDYFDPDFFMYSEDLDIGFRAILKNFQASISQDSIVFHKGSKSTGKNSDFSIYQNHRNLFWVIIKNWPLNILLRYLFWIIFVQFIDLFYYILKGKGLMILKSKFDMLKGIPKMLLKRRLIQKSKLISNLDLIKKLENRLIIRELI